MFRYANFANPQRFSVISRLAGVKRKKFGSTPKRSFTLCSNPARLENTGERINAGNGNFPVVNVPFSKNHRPIPIEGATYYFRPSHSGKRTPIHNLATHFAASRAAAA